MKKYFNPHFVDKCFTPPPPLCQVTAHFVEALPAQGMSWSNLARAGTTRGPAAAPWQDPLFSARGFFLRTSQGVHKSQLTQDSQAVIRGWAGHKTVAGLGREVLNLGTCYRVLLAFGVLD